MKRLLLNNTFAVILPIKNIPLHHAGSTSFIHWLASIPTYIYILILLAAISLPSFAYAVSGSTQISPLATLAKWIPVLITKGFLMNLIISFLTMLFGTIMGLFLGMGQISPNIIIRQTSIVITQVFRNSPWLVLLFIVMLSFPFEINIGEYTIPFPDWLKAVVGLSLPLMANVAEIVRGAIQSVPTGQWEASESLAFSRHQTLWKIILPQTIKRMIPPWMNWYAIMTMATPLVSLLGVTEVVNLSRQAMEAENNNPSLLVPFYGFCLIIFFLYTYPIARLTIALEKRFSVKL
jgi:polar amino acid transport system permease protein